MSKPVIIVTGANGQLGQELQQLETLNPGFEFHFLGRDSLPLDQEEVVRELFQTLRPAYLVNCAAYTAVDKAETDKEAAFLTNATAVGLLADLSNEYKTRFIHVSTDYVFDGAGDTAYQEDAPTNPLGVYGASKLQGERLAFTHNPETVVMRTSWVYSAFGNNFVKTMLRLMKDRPSLNVVSDQVGSPTYAADLAGAILDIIKKHHTDHGTWFPGIYHFSNEAEISWFDFAKEIARITGSNCEVSPIPSSAYPTPAKRPMYSLMDKSKFVTTFNVPLQPWKDSLEKCIAVIQNS